MKNSLPILTLGVVMTSLVGFSLISNINTNAALPAPGGVDTNLALWLDANQGVSEFEGQVTGWSDQSGNNNDGVPTGSSLYWDDSELNFNSSVYFDGDWFDIASDLGLGGTNDFTVFSVSENGSYNDPSTIIGPQSTGSGLQLRYFNDTPNIMSTFNALILGGNNEVNSPSLLRASSSGNDFDLFNDGTANGSVNSSYSFPFGNMSIGSSLDTEIFEGEINEVVVYNTVLTQTQINQVETYLALKYGMQLDESINDYLNSTGSSVYDVDDGAGEGTPDDGNAEWGNVYGIGKDINSGLDQRVTQTAENYEEEDSIEIALGTNNNLYDSGSNSDRPDTLSDGDYVVIGDDGGSVYYDYDFGDGEENRLGRTWKVQETGNPGTVYLEIDGEFTYDSNYALVVSDDMNFDESDTIIDLVPGEEGEGPFEESSPAHFPVDFANGTQYVTIIQQVPEIIVNNPEGLEVVEEGEAGVFEVSLSAQPMDDDVYITIDASDGEPIDINPTSLTFTYENWDVPQEVSVTGLSDPDDEDEEDELEFYVDGESSYEYYDASSVYRDVTVKDDENASNDNDGDGITNGEEAQAPNSGDANGDGTPDSSQSNVASSVSSDSGEFVTIEGTGACQTVGEFEVVTEASLGVDDTENNFNYGLADFEMECGTPGETVDITIIWDQEYDTSTWRYRKFDGTNYINIDDEVTYGTRTVGGVVKTTSTYSITDGGALDLDGTANGTIVDPAGPGVAATPLDEFGDTSSGDGMGGLIRTGGFARNSYWAYLAVLPLVAIGMVWRKLRKSK